MIKLDETAVWEEVIQGIATSEPLRGGQDGPLNRALKQLGNRTLNLKDRVEEIERKIESGIPGTGDPGTGDPPPPPASDLTGITITSSPYKTEYEVGEPFNCVGIRVGAVCSDGSVLTIYQEYPAASGANGYVLSVPDLTSEGTKSVTVTYKGFSTTFDITVTLRSSTEVYKTLGSLAIGDKIKVGSLYGKKTIWKISDKEHPGYPENSVSLLTERLVKLGAFDAKEAQNSNGSRKIYGNNRYSDSNLFQWLNSEKDAGAWYTPQHLADAPPTKENCNNCNGYDTLAGFLAEWTDFEKSLLLDTTVPVNKADIDGGGQETVTGKIHLLSYTEVGLSKDAPEGSVHALFTSGGSIGRVAMPTAETIANSDYTASSLNVNSGWLWWCRSPDVSAAPYYVRNIDYRGSPNSNSAYHGPMGIRTFCNLSRDTFLSSTPDADGCYTLIDPATVTDIEISALPDKLVYLQNETLDLSGLVVNEVHLDGSKVTLSYDSEGITGYKVSSPDMSTLGGKLVTVTYQHGDKTFSLEFSVQVTTLTRTTPTPLSVARDRIIAATVGNYALFAGGTDMSAAAGNTIKTDVDAYDTSLTRKKPASLSIAAYTSSRAGSSATVGNYAIIGGSGGSRNIVDAYDASLTRTTPSPLSVARANWAATTVGGYALFAGGTNSNVVDAYDASLTRTTPSPLSIGREYLAAATVGNYALFAGGRSGPGGSILADVDAYDVSLTRTTPSPLVRKKMQGAATTVGGYALFIVGNENSQVILSTDVDAYDVSLTHTTPSPLSCERSMPVAATVRNYAIIAGGWGSTNPITLPTIVDAYDASLTRTTQTPLSQGRGDLSATTVGNYALFAGGIYSYSPNIVTAVVDAYGIA